MSGSHRIALLTFVAFLLGGCRHSGSSAWEGFGEPGSRRIAVHITGDVKHPGQYYLVRGANLESVYRSFGGWGGLGEKDGAPPTRVVLTRSGGRASSTMTYRISRMSPAEKEAVELKEGDILYYPATTR